MINLDIGHLPVSETAAPPPEPATRGRAHLLADNHRAREIISQQAIDLIMKFSKFCLMRYSNNVKDRQASAGLPRRNNGLA
jgi:hypothetical protein